MNPGWIIISVIVGAILGFLGTLGLELFRRSRLREDFKEGVITELKEALPRLVSYYVKENLNDKILKWAESILLKLREESSKQEKAYLDETIEYLRKLVKDKKYKWAGPHKFSLSILKEPITSFSLLEPNLRISVVRIRTNLNLINGFIEFIVSSYFRMNRDEISKYIEQDIKQSLKRISSLSYETSELIKEIIFE